MSIEWPDVPKDKSETLNPLEGICDECVDETDHHMHVTAVEGL